MARLGAVIGFVALVVGCDGVSSEAQLVFDPPPPIPSKTGGQTPGYRDPRCGAYGSGISGEACSNPSGVSGGADSDAGVTADSGPGGPADTGVPPPPPCDEITFEHTDRAAASVWVSGTFVRWGATPAEGAIALTNDGSGAWSATVRVEPGRHEYKLIIDGGEWIADPANPEVVPDGLGGNNSLLVVCDAACGDLEAYDWRDAVMYFAMIDRFKDGDPGNNDPVLGASDGDARFGPSGQYEGGDLAGLEQSLEYLAGLGVTAVWLSAPYDNRDSAGRAIDSNSDTHLYSGYHGYWPKPRNTDYSDMNNPTPRPLVESRIGTESDLRSFVDAAHGTTGADGHTIKVLFDYVMNHVDVESELYAAHPDWFAKKQDGSFALCGPENLWEDPYWGTRCAFTDYLPPFEFANDQARAWSVNDALWWATELGIDGYRLDAIKHVPLSWLRDLRSRLNSDIQGPAGGRFYLVGETFSYDDRNLIRSFVDPDTLLDGQFDFPFKARVCEAAYQDFGRMDTLAGWMADNDGFYGSRSIMTTWIGNHDIPRTIHFASRQIQTAEKEATARTAGPKASLSPWSRSPTSAWAFRLR